MGGGGGGGEVLIDRDTVLDLRLSLTSKDHRLLLQVCLLFRAACLSLWVQGISRGREKVSSQNDDAPLKCFSHVSKAAQFVLRCIIKPLRADLVSPSASILASVFYSYS